MWFVLASGVAWAVRSWPKRREAVWSSIDMEDLFHQTWDVALALWATAQEVAQFSVQRFQGFAAWLTVRCIFERVEQDHT